MKTLRELKEAIEAKSKAIQSIFAEAGEDMDFNKVKSLQGDTQAKLDAIKTMNNELDALHKEYEQARELSDIRKNADAKAGIAANLDVRQPPEPEAKGQGLGDLFIKSGVHKAKGASVLVPEVNLKTTMSRSAGWDPEAMRISRVELYPLRKLTVLDLYPQYNTDRDTIKYMKETTHTNNAAEKAEGTAYGEAALALTETSDEVEKVGIWLPVTDEQLEDVSGLAQYGNNRLLYMLGNRIDSQLLEGNGTTPNIWGAAQLSSVQTVAKGSDPTPDAIFKAMTKVRGTTAGTGFGEPSAVVLHPNDWQDIRLLRTADGIYIFGSPIDPGPERIWGVPVLVTSAKTEGTGLVGDFTGYAGVFWKRGITFKVTDSHDKYFIYGTQAIRADVRLAAVYFRDSAFCTVTGI